MNSNLSRSRKNSDKPENFPLYELLKIMGEKKSGGEKSGGLKKSGGKKNGEKKKMIAIKWG